MLRPRMEILSDVALALAHVRPRRIESLGAILEDDHPFVGLDLPLEAGRRNSGAANFISTGFDRIEAVFVFDLHRHRDGS